RDDPRAVGASSNRGGVPSLDRDQAFAVGGTDPPKVLGRLMQVAPVLALVAIGGFALGACGGGGGGGGGAALSTQTALTTTTPTRTTLTRTTPTRTVTTS